MGSRHSVRRHAIPASVAAGGMGSAVAALVGIFAWQRKAASTRRALRRSEERFRLLTTSTVELVGIIDEDLRFAYLSPAAQHLFGRTADSFVGVSVEQGSHPDDAERIIAPLHDLMQRPGESVEPVRHRIMSTVRRRWVWVETSATNRFDEPSVRGIIFHTRDVTLQEEAQALLSEAHDRAVEASRLKSSFVATVSHEIRNPMHSVLGAAEILLSGELTDAQRALVAGIHQSAGGLREILDDILDFSKIEAGKMTIEAVDFDVRTLVNAIDHEMSMRAVAKGLQVVVDVHEDVPISVCGDVVRVRQILTNLLSNAVKFTDEGVVRLTVCAASEPNFLRFTVEDAGIGIAPDRLPELFQPFVQADLSTTRRFGGSGLGLSICAQLASLMGGRIDATSQVGVGSTFVFEAPLPASDGRATTNSAMATGSSPRTERVDLDGLRVLLVEDNDVNRDIAIWMLHELGATVVAVADGAAAIERYGAQPFDIVLMDCEMPVLDGFDATLAIRQFEMQTGRAATPVLALTANVMNDQRERILAVGMNNHLGKPFSRDELRAAIVECISDVTLVDFDVIRQYPIELFGRVFTSYRAQLQERVDEIESVIGTSDHKAVAEAVHALRSPSAVLGLAAVTEWCKNIEDRSYNGEVVPASSTDELRELLGRSIDTVRELFTIH